MYDDKTAEKFSAFIARSSTSIRDHVCKFANKLVNYFECFYSVIVKEIFFVLRKEVKIRAKDLFNFYVFVKVKTKNLIT